MDAAANYNASSPQSSLYSGGIGSEFSKSSMSLKTSSGGDTRETESSGEVLARYELDIACISEKLTNLNLLSMHAENKEIDLEAFETFVSDVDPDLVVKVLEYDILAGFLDSEVKSLETHISELQFEKANVSEFLSSRKHMGEPLLGMEDMLRDSETSLEQSMEQVMEIKMRTENFDRNVLRFGGEEDYTDSLNNSDPLELKEKMKMQTVEHQRHVLRMLEKSLAREIDLEKRVSELTEVEEALKIRLHLSEKEVFNAEDEAETILEKLYETNHSTDLLTETSREFISKIEMLEFNLKGSNQREAELKNDLLKLEERVNDKDSTEVIVEMEKTIKNLREEISVAESRAVKAEDTCQCQNETIQELKDTYEKVVSLEKELSDANVKVQNADAWFEASEENKSMLESTIEDMSNVIDDMRKKVAKAETENESLEDKCISLSESNADLKKKLSFVMGKLKCLETSMHQMKETTKASAKDINLRSKLITDLVKQMTLERERLQKQISSLKQENKILVKRVKRADVDDPVVKVSHSDKASSNDVTTENKEAPSTNFEVATTSNETVVESTETVRNIDARQLQPKDIMRILLILIIPILGYFFIKA